MNSFNTFHSNVVKNGIIDNISFNNDLYENIGLYGEIAYNIIDDYYKGNPYWFDNSAYVNKIGYITILDSLERAVLPLAKLIDNTFTMTTLNDNNRYGCQWTGYFKSDYTGTWTFYLDTDNWSNLWIGDNAIYGYTTSNRLLTDDYNTNTGNANLSAATINLVKGKYYPIRIQWGKETGGISFQFSFSKDGGVTRITDTSAYLYSAKPYVSTRIGMPAVFIKKTLNTTDNLYAPKLFVQYTDKGYHGNAVNYVQNNPLHIDAQSQRVSKGPSYIANIGNMDEVRNTLGFTFPTSDGVHDKFSFLYTGYFKADFTGTFTFNFNTDDETYLWIGDYAITGYTTSNRLVYSYAGSNGTGSISLENGKYYPIRILYGQYIGPGSINLSFTRNGQTITDWTGYTFHPITPVTGNPKMFIDEIVYIGGTDSPIKSYFTDYIVNVPTGVGLDKYAGYYDVTCSSIYFTDSFLPYNIFKGDNSFWSAASQINSFKPITNESLNYTQNPYNATTGIYVGGGNSSLTYSTTYYTKDNTTAIASGEWVQIMVPYNMKLTSYSNSTRYTNSRIPVQYVILGSIDANTWYALDDIDIGTHASYSSLKKYTINTTSYPYAANYYCYFRYIIKKLDSSSSGDKITANENQWNLVGVKEPINQDLIYIGGKNSPINSYFTNYIVNIPTGESVDKYAGSYAVTASSIYGTSWTPYNVFKGGNTVNAARTEFTPAWHSAGSGSAYKSITNELLTYSQSPYNNGVYRGGGNADVYFSTTYYTSGNITTTAAGEWIQIFVPYNMKLLSYNARSRYSLSRRPIQYVILGSTDGSSNWYALDEVAISPTSYSPFKKYTINTTTYPYANNYYCYFRYVIKKLEDSDLTNENQWNLVGVKEPINQDLIYIGGKNSPINSYFTNYIVNVPTGVGVDKYAGSYEVTSSSFYNDVAKNEIEKPFYVFNGDNAFVNKVVGSNTSTYYITWWGAGADTVGYKPITNESLGYTRSPYALDGVYQGGGTVASTFSTNYYINGTSTSVDGEWIQINTPYNMRLTSYNARSRFSDCRVPVKYVILGSNDGSSWYALHIVDIGTWDKYIPLKNYTINTTAYPYAANYYSYFRYVIQKVDTSPNSTIATDKRYAHENQWNLVGIKETPNVNVGKTIYIGANSPSNFASYFTSRNVTIPSNFVSPEYVGTYTITESSTTVDTIGANLFRNDSGNNGTSYYVIWHCGYVGNSYINGNVVTYNRQPYASNGVYQGVTGYIFTTPYYKTADSSYSSPGFGGEWAQIKLPFRMKLTGYSHRTRYLNLATNGRNPSYYTIFGSNDGTIWYIVDTQNTSTTTLNTINIDTSTYPDGKHGYSYFRWVIQNVTVGSSVAGDVANENQWNLIGVRTT